MLLTVWVAIQTWQESEQFLLDNQQELSGRGFLQFLNEQQPKPVVLKHLAILTLIGDPSADVGDVYDVVTDTNMSIGRILAELHHGRSSLAVMNAHANLAVLSDPFYGPFVAAIASVLTGDDAQALDLLDKALEGAEPIDRLAAQSALEDCAMKDADRVDSWTRFAKQIGRNET